MRFAVDAISRVKTSSLNLDSAGLLVDFFSVCVLKHILKRASMNCNFNALLSESRFLSQDLLSQSVDTQRFQLQRPVPQLNAQSRLLSAKLSPFQSQSKKSDKDAALFGIDAGRLEKSLSIAIEASFTLGVLSAVSLPDLNQLEQVPGAVRSQQESAVARVIEYMHAQSMADHESAWDSSLMRRWNDTKKAIFASISSFGSVHSIVDQTPSSVGLHTLEHSTITATPSRSSPASTTHVPIDTTRVQEYAKSVVAFNDSRLQPQNQNEKSLVSLLNKAALAASSGSPIDTDVVETWELVAYIVGETVQDDGRSSSVSVPQSVCSSATSGSDRALSGGIKWLEHQ